ncbi:hypothetical protein [Nonomuraea sp. NPDC050643]|uniref:hypothetical protein n=1 Tax=Nonomuraea sp. NPDC050643 TaxID=3155660 RepID=UPI00340051F9
MTKVLETLAAYTQANALDTGGGHLRTALLAAVLVDRHEVDPGEAIALARYDAFDSRVREAGNEVERLIKEARRAVLAAEMGEEVPA